ncbi:DUF5131 family protein, partial [Treponema endosymbiont of Eucomonympha sp.]|uniref:DUF5131 family protein n=1 Tax=Treponema endosymbiont of Eucomonympha sp. TaxID=1580831 RepID=UPI0007807A8D
MALRKARGDMYPFITHTWNPIKGKCPHGCGYCYVDRIARRFGTEQKAPHLDECELRVNLGVDNYIFIGSSIDLFSEGVRDIDICRALHHAGEFKNRYLLQSKHPERALFFFDSFPFNYRNENEYSDNIIFATTAETNRHYPAVMGNAPPVAERLQELEKFPTKTMVTVEPILDFDL